MTTADSNVMVGADAGNTITTGSNNVIIGGNADADANAATGLVVVGSGSTAFGSSSTAIGRQAKAAGGGVAIGANAGDAQAAVDIDNVFIGNNAGGAANGTSTDNTCVGDLACDSLTTGDGNIIIGSTADVEAAADSNAIAIGAPALAEGGSIAIGYTATTYDAGGLAVGYESKSSDGVALGYRAGFATGAADDDNVFVGFSAGLAATGTSTDNTCVGDAACDTTTTGDRVVALGANTDVGTAADSDVTVIGESMVGKASDSILIGFGGREHYYHHGAGKALVAGGADEVFGLSVATVSYTSATVSWVVVADDSTDAQSLAGMAILWAINKADTEDCNMEELTAGTDEATSSGTLTAVPTWVAGTNECVFNLNAASSLTETTLDAYYTVTINGPATTITLK
jgi:hypothetical protein